MKSRRLRCSKEEETCLLGHDFVKYLRGMTADLLHPANAATGHLAADTVDIVYREVGEDKALELVKEMENLCPKGKIATPIESLGKQIKNKDDHFRLRLSGEHQKYLLRNMFRFFSFLFFFVSFSERKRHCV